LRTRCARTGNSIFFNLEHSRLVAFEGTTIQGWAALTPVSGRCVYAGVAEVSVYIHSASRGHGINKTLLQALITESESNGLWTLQAGIFPENTASIQLHEKSGFRVIGSRENRRYMTVATSCCHA
jgi:L-amino acid N-acyltransferase YncA